MRQDNPDENYRKNIRCKQKKFYPYIQIVKKAYILVNVYN